MEIIIIIPNHTQRINFIFKQFAIHAVVLEWAPMAS